MRARIAVLASALVALLAGTAAAVTCVTRPSGNTGTGFFVSGSKLYDANGQEFRIRGVNKLHWDLGGSGVYNTHANTMRWDIDFTQSASTNLGLMNAQTKAHNMVPVPGNWAGTCDESAATLTSIVDTWVAQASTWTQLNATMILDVANEWGPSSTTWRDSYITAIGRLRTAGYTCPIMIDSGGCGQDYLDLVNYATAVLASDPQHNIIFSLHVYGMFQEGAPTNGGDFNRNLATSLTNIAATGIAFVVGEFGPGRNIGPSPTLITPVEVMSDAEAVSAGWLAWAWDDNYAAGDSWFALSNNGNYSSSADLTTFGKSVVEDATYGTLVLAKYNTAWGGGTVTCTSATPVAGKAALGFWGTF